MWQFTNNGELKVKRFVLDCLQRAVISSLTTIMLLSFALTAQAALPPEVIKGVAWLQSQIQPDGSILNESLSQATSVQNRSEVLITLNRLGRWRCSLALKGGEMRQIRKIAAKKRGATILMPKFEH